MERIQEEFTSIVQEDYTNYCKATGTEETIQGYTEYLLNRNVINDKTVNRFVVISKYPVALDENLGIKKMAIYSIQDVVPLSFRAIVSILKHYATAFRSNVRLIP